MDVNTLIALGSMVGSGGLAVGITSMKLRKVEELATWRDKHEEADHAVHLDVVDRLARSETKIDSAHARLKTMDSKIDELLRRS